MSEVKAAIVDTTFTELKHAYMDRMFEKGRVTGFYEAALLVLENPTKTKKELQRMLVEKATKLNL